MTQQFSGAGVLLFEVNPKTNEIELVLFRDKHKRAYVDPGGKMEHYKHSNDPITTAQEELFEESASLIKMPRTILSEAAYVEQQVGKKKHWYRAYIVLIDRLSKRDYKSNVRYLDEIDAESHLQETDNMARIPLSRLYRLLVQDDSHSEHNLQLSVKNKDIKLHRRIVQLLLIAFGNDPKWLSDTLAKSPVESYRRTETPNKLIVYEF